jgi:hypothetical protein
MYEEVERWSAEDGECNTVRRVFFFMICTVPDIIKMVKVEMGLWNTGRDGKYIEKCFFFGKSYVKAF